ncbi:MAG: T9SS type A sorting domain-containing protein [Candidatus Marinimicrobia bacterium]|nr:T9SS type A sorting domain-containing protein [Candidatus Neomarinimicrobiota bacterium]
MQNFRSTKVYNLLGVEVATLVNDFKVAGRYNVQWQAGDLASGVYLVQMRSNDFTQTRKVMLMK